MRVRYSIAALVVAATFVAITSFLYMPKVIAAEKFIEVEVREGDTLWAIAKRHMKNPGQWEQLLKYNKLDNPDLIRPGMKLKIPVRLLKQAATIPPPPHVDTTPKPIPAGSAGTVVHVARNAVVTHANGKDETLRIGSVLRKGDRIVTDNLSFCSVNLGDGKVVIGPDSRLMVEHISCEKNKCSTLAMRAIQGFVRVDAETNTGVQLRSKFVSLRSQGSKFIFQVEEEDMSRLDVHSGGVEVKSGSFHKIVSVGQGIVVESKGRVAGPLDLPPAPLPILQNKNVGGSMHRGAKWEHVPGATSYRVEVALDKAFIKPVYFAGYAGDSIDFGFLASYPAGQYYIRLFSVDHHGLWSAPSNPLPYKSQ